MSQITNVNPFEEAANAAVAKNQEEEIIQPDEVVEEIEEIVPETTEEVETPELEDESEESEETHDETESTSEEETSEVELESSNEEEPEVSIISDDWDESVTEEVVDEAPSVDIAALAKQFGIEATSQEQLVSEVTKIKGELETARTSDPLADLPDNLKKAIDIAKIDGDYLQYLGVTSVDYANVDDAVLVQDQLSRLLLTPQGETDIEKLADAMDNMTDVEIEVQGKRLKAELIGQQEQFKRQVQSEAQEVKAQADKDLKLAIDKLTEYRGFKPNSTHKKKLYDSISSGKIVQDLFYGDDGKMDFDKVVQLVFEKQNGAAMNKYLQRQITTSTKKALLKKVGNVTTSNERGQLPAATSKKLTAVEQASKYLREGGKI